jgi:hypothetical protein
MYSDLPGVRQQLNSHANCRFQGFPLFRFQVNRVRMHCKVKGGDDGLISSSAGLSYPMLVSG